MGFKFAHLWQGMDGMAKILRRKKYFMESRGAQTFWFFLVLFGILFWESFILSLINFWWLTPILSATASMKIRNL